MKQHFRRSPDQIPSPRNGRNNSLNSLMLPMRTLKLERGFWKSYENQRFFFDQLAISFNIQSPRDWGHITYDKLVENGGSSLLNYYGNSIQKALRGAYPNIDWRKEWFRTRKGFKYWKSKSNQRKFMETLGQSFNIKTPSEWGKVTIKSIRNAGGSSLIYLHKGSLFRLLSNVFPEVQWKTSWFENIPSFRKGHWQNKSNQLLFFENLQKELRIKSITDWKNISTSQVIEHGGKSIIDIHGGSLIRAIDLLYSPTLSENEALKWRSLVHKPNNLQKCTKISFKSIPKIVKQKNYSNFPHNFWKSIDSYQYFFYNVAKKANVGYHELATISKKKIMEYGGSSMLNYFQGSIVKALAFSFPEYTFKSRWDTSFQRKFLDSFAKRAAIHDPRDWGKVTVQMIMNEGGKQIIHKHGGSLFKALTCLYPEVEWRKTWFSNIPKYPSSYWKSIHNHKSFLEEIALTYHIQSSTDWRKISNSLLKRNGGRGLLKRYSNSLKQALFSIYGNTLEKKSVQSAGKGSEIEKSFRLQLEQLLKE